MQQSQLHESTNSCTFTVALHEFTDSYSHRQCYSHVSFIAHFVDLCNRAWQLTWPCGGPMLLGGPACRNTALWLEEARLGWMSTVHRAESTRDSTGTPPFTFSALFPSCSCTHTLSGTQEPCLSHQSLSLFSWYCMQIMSKLTRYWTKYSATSWKISMSLCKFGY